METFDFEQSVLLIFDQTGNVSQEVQGRAHSLLESVTRSETGWQMCLGYFETSQHVEVQFWCLQTLHEITKSKVYDSLGTVEKNTMKRSLLSWGTDPGRKHPVMIRNKLAQVVVAIAAKEYPHTWPTFFEDILSSLNEAYSSIDFFSRILISVHEDIISLELPRSAEEARQSMEFKDAMRDNALDKISLSWYQILEMFKDVNPSVVALLLNAVERYVHWIDISLVANEKFIPLLFDVLNSTDSEVQVSAISMLTEIVAKRMDAGPKLHLVSGLGLVPITARWAETGVPGVESEDHDVAVVSCKLLTNLASEILESWKKVENSVISMQAVGVSLDDETISEAYASCNMASLMMEQLFPTVVRAFRIPDDEISSIVAPFMLSYMNRIKIVLKRNGELTPCIQAQIVSLLDAAAHCTRFDSTSSLYPVTQSSMEEKVMAEEEENNIAVRRQEVFSLFRNASKISPMPAYELVARKLQESLMNAQGSVVWQDAEIALSLFYQLGEGTTESALKSESPVSELAAAIIQLDDDVASHRLVALALLEACARYSKVAIYRKDLLPLLASKFFGKVGLGHPSASVPPRAAYLLCRTVKSLRSQIVSISRQVLQALIPHLQSIARTPLANPPLGMVAAGASSQVGASGAGVSTPDDRLFAFEAAGIVVGLFDEKQIDEQIDWLKILTGPLIQQLQTQDPTNGLIIQQILEALTRLSKGFPPKMCVSRPRLADALIEPLRPAVEVVQKFATAKDIRCKYLAYIHRLVEGLGTALVPHLTTIIWSLQHPGIDAGDFKDILVLLNQIILRYAHDDSILDPLVNPLFGECVVKVRELLGSDWDWSGRAAIPAMIGSPTISGSDHAPSGSTEIIREKGELQKQYFTFVNSVSQCSVIDSVLSPSNSVALADVFQGAISHVDPAVRKLCISTLGNLVHHWVSLMKGTKVARKNLNLDQEEIMQLAYRKFGCEVLIFSLLVKPKDGGIDIRDAASISLLTEIANQVKSLYSIGGELYVQTLCQEAMSTLGWPAETAQQVGQQIIQLEGRSLRTYLKSVFLEYRKI